MDVQIIAQALAFSMGSAAAFSAILGWITADRIRRKRWIKQQDRELQWARDKGANTTPPAAAPTPYQFPTVVCLCGSTRFPEAWKRAYREESLAGHIVLSVGVMIHGAGDAYDEPIRDNSPIKAKLDALHLRKIDLADEILVLNVGGYVGASTAREIAYARANHTPIRWLENSGPNSYTAPIAPTTPSSSLPDGLS